MTHWLSFRNMKRYWFNTGRKGITFPTPFLPGGRFCQEISHPSAYPVLTGEL